MPDNINGKKIRAVAWTHGDDDGVTLSGGHLDPSLFEPSRVDRAAVLPVQMRSFVGRQDDEAKVFPDKSQQGLVALVLRHQLYGLDRQRAVRRDVLDLGPFASSSCGLCFDRPYLRITPQLLRQKCAVYNQRGEVKQNALGAVDRADVVRGPAS